MEYVLENLKEAHRLELQATFSNYLLKEELVDLSIEPGSRVLDAGCGSGLLSRFLVDQFPDVQVTACDASAQRLEQAARFASGEKYENIRFINSQVEAMSVASDSMDWVFCRFVLEHLVDPLVAVKEFHRILKNQGRVCLVDLDGILFNLSSANEELEDYLTILRAKWESDLFIGRKMPALLKRAGFSKIKWNASVMEFHGQDLLDELELSKQRLQFIEPTIEKHLNSKILSQRFMELYLAEMQKPEATLVYNKFIVYGEKQNLEN